jgi:SAM-dependent methyltransferase
MAEARDDREIPAWKIKERDRFLSLLQREGKQTLLEIGCGPGKYARFFQDHGLTVVCTDLSPEMVRLCREKGLEAYAMDFLNLDFPEHSFDAVFALNCLLHVPKADLPRVLQGIRSLLVPTGLFYLGIYGGVEYEGVSPDDAYEPKRFFSFHTDDQIRQVTTAYFDLVSFKTIQIENDEPGFQFQSLILRPPQALQGDEP